MPFFIALYHVSLTCKPSAVHAQRLTCSNCYGSNCAKGSVYLQYCGWIGVYVLWTGGVADSDYLSHDYDNDEDGILRAQKYFQENDLVDRKIKAFHMTLDNVDTS